MPEPSKTDNAGSDAYLPMDPLILKALSALEATSKAPAAYFRVMTEVADEYVQAGAWAQLLATASVQETDWPEIVLQSRHPFVRNLAVNYFEFAFEHDLSLKAAAAGSDQPPNTGRQAILARVQFDSDATILAAAQAYLATGASVHLLRAVQAAEALGGWRAALPWLARVFALNPADKDAAVSICNLLLQSNNFELAQQFSGRLARMQMHEGLSPLASGTALIAKGEYARGIDVLQTLHSDPVATDVHQQIIEARAHLQRAEAYDKLGDYRRSFAEFSELNRRSRSAKYDPRKFHEVLEKRKQMKVPDLPRDSRNDVTVMLGFPRSGTTLLENALNMHPLVETFEEIPTHKAAVAYIQGKVGPYGTVAAQSVPHYQTARARYYRELDLRRRKAGTIALVDKLPIQSGEASFMKRLFPERRYIFSIRHPFDVVLSCFRQQFTPNTAMENFRTIEDAVRLYDFVMQEWFGVFSLTSPEVCYVRYEELVEDFEGTVRRTLDFLGVHWDGSVLGFAQAADNRGHKTPSYQKVRQGLTIGVQTYWRNYMFVFDAPEAKPLHKWAEFFGYPTK